MALNAYLKLKGQKQGDIKGSVTQKGREGKIAVIAVEHEVVVPRDAATGLPAGKRMHKPYTITKELDASTPLLYAALVNNELISEFELQFWTSQTKGTAGIGAEVQHFTVRLTDARLIDIRFHQLNNRNPDLAKYAEHEELSFSYASIQWTWVAGGITAGDVGLGAGRSTKQALKPAAKKPVAKALATDPAAPARRRKT